MKQRVRTVAKSRNISQAHVVREALTKHFVGSELIDIEF